MKPQNRKSVSLSIADVEIFLKTFGTELMFQVDSGVELRT